MIYWTQYHREAYASGMVPTQEKLGGFEFEVLFKVDRYNRGIAEMHLLSLPPSFQPENFKEMFVQWNELKKLILPAATEICHKLTTKKIAGVKMPKGVVAVVIDISSGTLINRVKDKT